jgi:hypothetical protein
MRLLRPHIRSRSHMRKAFFAKLQNYFQADQIKKIIPIDIREKAERAQILTERATFKRGYQ